MSDSSSSISTLSDVPSISPTLRRSKGMQESCAKWIVPVIAVAGLGLVIYLIMKHWRCDSPQKYYGNNNSNNYRNDYMTGGQAGASGPVGKVIDLSGTQLMSAMDQKPVVCAFLADGCGWCTKLKPEYHAAAQRAKHPMYTLYASRDGAMDVLKMFQIRGFPTIYVVYKGKIMDEYKGNRTSDDIANWINSNPVLNGSK